jgi:hypothetical protein
MSEYEIEGSRHRRQATIRRGMPVQLRRRKEYRRFTDTERQNFHRAGNFSLEYISFAFLNIN